MANTQLQEYIQAETILSLIYPYTLTEAQNKYHTLSKKYHPDINPSDPQANQKMIELNNAWMTIKKNYQEVSILRNQLKEKDFKFSQIKAEMCTKIKSFGLEHSEKYPEVVRNVTNIIEQSLKNIEKINDIKGLELSYGFFIGRLKGYYQKVIINLISNGTLPPHTLNLIPNLAIPLKDFLSTINNISTTYNLDELNKKYNQLLVKFSKEGTLSIIKSLEDEYFIAEYNPQLLKNLITKYSSTYEYIHHHQYIKSIYNDLNTKYQEAITNLPSTVHKSCQAIFEEATILLEEALSDYTASSKNKSITERLDFDSLIQLSQIDFHDLTKSRDIIYHLENKENLSNINSLVIFENKSSKNYKLNPNDEIENIRLGYIKNGLKSRLCYFEKGLFTRHLIEEPLINTDCLSLKKFLLNSKFSGYKALSPDNKPIYILYYFAETCLVIENQELKFKKASSLKLLDKAPELDKYQDIETTLYLVSHYLQGYRINSNQFIKKHAK